MYVSMYACTVLAGYLYKSQVPVGPPFCNKKSPNSGRTVARDLYNYPAKTVHYGRGASNLGRDGRSNASPALTCSLRTFLAFLRLFSELF